MIVIFDYEVYKHDWFVCILDVETQSWEVIHNDNDRLINYINTYPQATWFGCNIKHYDNHIQKAVVNNFTPEEIKALNDFIISGGNGWDYPPLKDKYSMRYAYSDLFDDVQDGVSLKGFEAHMGMSIVECSVPFDLNRKLTDKECEEVIYYCKNDVLATYQFLKLRIPYIKTKIDLGNKRGIAESESLRCTNAQIVAKYLQAKRVERNDGRNYKHPPNLNLDNIPQQVLDFFETIHDMTIPDEVLFKTHLDIEIAGCPSRYAWGGVHGAPSTINTKKSYYEIKKAKPYHFKATPTRLLKNKDVSSLYPSLMIKYNCVSRNIGSPTLYEETYRERLAAKHSGDKATATVLKLPLNTASGAGEAKFNDMYDPLPTRSMRIYGQLFLTDLVFSIKKKAPSFLLVNFNTDGIAYEINADEDHLVDEACAEWEKRTGFELETDVITEIWQKDVNNLLFIKDNGEVKKVGGYLNYGISTKNAFTINNNYTIVKDALINYLTKGTSVEETINSCNDIFKFQIISKAGSYGTSYHIVNGVEVPVQKVNRVYATTDTSYGTLYKRNPNTGEQRKVEALPPHCIVDNANELTLDKVDKQWYIKKAIKYIADFLGTETPKLDKRKVTSIARRLKKILRSNYGK